MRAGIRRAVSILDRRLEKPLLALGSALSGGAFIKAAFRLLRSGVRCDFVNVLLRNVRLENGSAAYLMIDSRGCEFPRDLLEGVFFREHPAMPVLRANPGIRFINTREILAPDAILHGTRFYREVMQVIGFRHAAGMFFWDHPPHTPEAIFSLLRGEGQPDFDDAEVALLERLYPHIDVAFRRVRTSEKERAVRRELHALTQNASRAACILDWDLRVADANRAARESCAQWNLGVELARRLKPPPFRLPAPLRDACAELKAHWRASLRNHPVTGLAERRIVPHPLRVDLRASVSMHLHESALLGNPGFLIEFEQTEPAPPLEGAGKRNGRAAFDALTGGERELARLVCVGKSNQEIADQTGKALGSVKNSLHAIFKKLHVPSRGGLIALLRVVIFSLLAHQLSGSEFGGFV